MKQRRRFTKKSPSKVQATKTRFRRSAKWLKFRKQLKKQQRTDPITGSALSVTANCHHLCLAPEKYEDISDPSNFVMLNKTSHDTVHFLYNAHQGWRRALLALASILKRMDRLNSMSVSAVAGCAQEVPE